MTEIDLLGKLDFSDAKSIILCKVKFMGVKEVAKKRKEKSKKFSSILALKVVCKNAQPDVERSKSVKLALYCIAFMLCEPKQNTTFIAVYTCIAGKQLINLVFIMKHINPKMGNN